MARIQIPGGSINVNDPALKAAYVLPQTVDLSVGDATLASVSRTVVLTGATASRTVTLPDASFACEVRNLTDYAQTLKRSGGTGTLTVDGGDVIELVG